MHESDFAQPKRHTNAKKKRKKHQMLLVDKRELRGPRKKNGEKLEQVDREWAERERERERESSTNGPRGKLLIVNRRSKSGSTANGTKTIQTR